MKVSFWREALRLTPEISMQRANVLRCYLADAKARAARAILQADFLPRGRLRRVEAPSRTSAKDSTEVASVLP